MNRFAANISTIFTEAPFLTRFQKAKECGFSLVECQFPYEYPIKRIRCELDKHQLSLVLINLPPGNWEKGERGLAIFPERADEFRRSVEEGIRYATELNVPYVHCMAGVLPNDLDREKAKETYMRHLHDAAKQMAQHSLTLLIEPINPFDMPNYFLTDVDEAVSIIKEIGQANIKLQYDFYHMQRTRGNLTATFDVYFDWIAHVQIADVPGRHEPGTGEVRYEYVFQFLKERGYSGAVGLEYIPSGNSEHSFQWMDDYCSKKERREEASASKRRCAQT
jgi:hydroxypyruvate isomerase